MAAANVTSQQVVGVLQANNLTFPAGQLRPRATRIPVSTIGRLTSVDQIARPRRRLPDAPADPVRRPAPAARRRRRSRSASSRRSSSSGVATTGYARTNGQPALTLTVTKTSTANTVRSPTAVEATPRRDRGRATRTRSDRHDRQDLSSFIVESQDGLLREGGLGALFAILTIFLFLFSLRSTLVAAISIPLSVLTALVLMQVAGITLNIMTLGGLAVAVGRVVDDAIVVLENIYRHRALGEDRLTAVIRGPREVARAITASTLTTVAVFLPIGFVGGLVSQFFLPFALTVTFALLASLICALTVVPVLAYLFIGRVTLEVDEDGEPKHSFWVRALHAAHHAAPCATAGRAGRSLGVGGGPVRRVARARPAAADPVHQRRLGEDPRGRRRPAGRRDLAGGARPDRPRPRRSCSAQPEVEIVQTSVPGEGDTGFQTLIAALQGQPANTRHDDRPARSDASTSTPRPTRPRQRRWRRSGPTATTSASRRPRASPRTASTSSSAARTRPRREPASDAVVAEPRRRRRPRQPQERPRQGHARDPGTRRSEQGRRRRLDRGPDRRRGPRRARRRRRRRTVGLDRRPSRSTSSSSSTRRRRPRSTSSAALPVGTVGQGAARDRSPTVEQVDVQGSITRIDGAPAAQITAEITSEDTGACQPAVQTADRRPRGRRAHPGRRRRRAGRRHRSSRTRPSAACSPRWPWPSCSST